jgi:hypothetical protein
MTTRSPDPSELLARTVERIDAVVSRIDSLVAELAALERLRRDVVAMLQAPPPVTKWRTPEEVAAEKGLHVATIRRRCKRGLIPGAEKDGPRLWKIPAA